MKSNVTQLRTTGSDKAHKVKAMPDANVVGTRALGTRMRWRRELLSWARDDLAIVLGKRRETIIRWENGTIYPRTIELEKIAEALDCSPCWLAFGKGRP